VAPGPLSRDQYEVVESFTDQVGAGKDYLKVRYKGLGTTGYLSRVAGPGKSISKSWYKEKKRQQPGEEPYDITAAIRKEYDASPETDAEDWNARLEITGTFRQRSQEDGEKRAEDKMKEILADAGAEIPPLQPGQLVIKTFAEPTESAPTGWVDTSDKPILTMEFGWGTKEYVVDVEAGEVEW